jgi:predicted TIM-barrel fold metal-dependent hydrolase
LQAVWDLERDSPVTRAAHIVFVSALVYWLYPPQSPAGETRSNATYKRIKAKIDAIPAIDTHAHLRPFASLQALTHTKDGPQVNLNGLFRASYLFAFEALPVWTVNDDFDTWWRRARHEFKNVRATSFYRYQLPAFQDLYGVDFDRLSDSEAKKLNARVVANYADQRWLYQVVTERANIELMLNDPYWACHDFAPSYPWEARVLNVTSLVRGFNRVESGKRVVPWGQDDPYEFAAKHGLPAETLDDYLAVLDRLFLEAKDKGIVGLKCTLAYQRTLRFEDVSRDQAAVVFGKRRSQLNAEQIRNFEDFIMWRLCALSAKYELPFQIHTGQARIQSSNPMNLVDLIEANPSTKFILLHGGFPWIGETGVIVQKHWKNVWIDSVWLPMLSYSMGKRAFHEWLEMFPSNRIMWGTDCGTAEGMYGAAEFHRRCLSEVLAEKVISCDLVEEHALQIAQQIMRDNALELFPQLKERLWKHKRIRLAPPAARK